MDSPNLALDLPTGWNSTSTSRPARYDPIIVTIFAVILACGITGTIAAIVWRNQHQRTKKLKDDLERATRPRRRRSTDEVDDVGGDSDVEEQKSREQTKKKRRRRKAGVSGGGAVAASAGKSSSTFWRPNSRLVGHLRSRYRRPKPAEVLSTTEPPIPTSPREQLANPPVTLVTAEPEQDLSTRVQSWNPSHVNIPLSSTLHEDIHSSETQAEPERIPANSVSSALPLPPVSSIHLNPSVDLDQSIPNPCDDAAQQLSPTVEGCTSNPPAYLGMERSWTPRRDGKAPLPGLEAEYDERDLERWRASRHVPSCSSSSPRLRSSIVRSAVEPELETRPPPRPRRVHGVHIATDDKAELARLHSLADQPDAALPPASMSPIPDAPTVPEFGVVDDWCTETQLEQVSSLDKPSSPTFSPPILGRLTLPPPPEPYLLSRHSLRHNTLTHDTSYHDTYDMNEAYTLRQVWGGTTPNLGPSAPPVVEEDGVTRGPERDQTVEGLVPSAPPLLDYPTSNAHLLPSAPAFCDCDEENESHEPPCGSAPPLEAPSEAPAACDEGSESTSGSSGEDARANAHPDVRVRWVQQRHVDIEGVGLPKYEP